MLAVFTTRSWKGNDRWNNEPSDRKPAPKTDRRTRLRPQATYQQQLRSPSVDALALSCLYTDQCASLYGTEIMQYL